MSLKRFIPGYRARWKARHGAYLKAELDGHDVVAEIEWSDGTVTYMGADYLPGDQEIELRNGLPIKIVGQGGEPVFISGVPVIRVHAEHACPVDTKVAIAMELEEEDMFERVDENGDPVDDGQTQAQPPTAAAQGNGQQPAVADGGMEGHLPGESPTPTGTNDVDDHKYDLSSPSGYGGYAFSLKSAIQRVPFAISPMALKYAEERGKQSQKQDGRTVRMFILGLIAGFLLPIIMIGFLWLLGQIGGGGGGSVLPALLPLLAGPRFGRSLSSWGAR